MSIELSRNLYEELKRKKSYEPSKGGWFDQSYEFFTSDHGYIDKSQFIKIIAFAYSWMPTIPSIGDIDTIWSKIETSINTVQQLTEVEIDELLIRLVPIVNNSIVGSSKILHFISPSTFPIIDSRVLKAWNNLFGENVDLKLKSSLLAKNDLEGAIKIYLKYRGHLLKWKEACGDDVSIRDLEKVLYLQV